MKEFDEILNKIAEVRKVNPENILNGSRVRRIAETRDMVYLVCMESGFTSTTTKLFMNRKNHTTILSGRNTARNLIDVYEDYRNDYLKVKDALGTPNQAC